MWRVLIVEDDPTMAVALKDGFKYQGYSVQLAQDGDDALRLVFETDPHLIILDVMLPKLSGFDVCKQLRNGGNNTPIIMLTARGQEIDKVLGLKIGADDYVTKPFSFLELIARVEALLRRTAKPAEEIENTQIYQFGDVTVDFKKFQITKGNRSLEISSRELKLMKFLIAHRGEVVTREQLLNAVWGYDSFPLTRTVDMHIAKLRQKIEDDPSNPLYIITVHRAGYKFIG
ncbi:MAG: response regulator transcription factor [Acidobacteriota bacterium]